MSRDLALRTITCFLLTLSRCVSTGTKETKNTCCLYSSWCVSSYSYRWIPCILSGRNRMIKSADMRIVEKAERFQELTIENVLDYCRENQPDIFEYLPTPVEPTRIHRGYLLSVTLLKSDLEYSR